MRFVIRIQLYIASQLLEPVIVMFFLPFFSHLLVKPEDKAFCIALSLENILKCTFEQYIQERKIHVMICSASGVVILPTSV